jgi:hypothetical protein
MDSPILVILIKNKESRVVAAENARHNAATLF